MSNRDRDRFRSYDSGCKKREKKKLKQDFLKTQEGSFNKFLCYKYDKFDSQNDVILSTKNSTIPQVSSEPENVELEREKSPELSSICFKSPKASDKDFDELPQTKINDFKESSSIEFLSYINNKFDSQNDVILSTKNSSIPQVSSEAENVELEREKSLELSPIYFKSPKALDKDSELPLTIISDFKESSSSKLTSN